MRKYLSILVFAALVIMPATAAAQGFPELKQTYEAGKESMEIDFDGFLKAKLGGITLDPSTLPDFSKTLEDMVDSLEMPVPSLPTGITSGFGDLTAKAPALFDTAELMSAFKNGQQDAKSLFAEKFGKIDLSGLNASLPEIPPESFFDVSGKLQVPGFKEIGEKSMSPKSSKDLFAEIGLQASPGGLPKLDLGSEIVSYLQDPGKTVSDMQAAAAAMTDSVIKSYLDRAVTPGQPPIPLASFLENLLFNKPSAKVLQEMGIDISALEFEQAEQREARTVNPGAPPAFGQGSQQAGGSTGSGKPSYSAMSKMLEDHYNGNTSPWGSLPKSIDMNAE